MNRRHFLASIASAVVLGASSESAAGGLFRRRRSCVPVQAGAPVCYRDPREIATCFLQHRLRSASAAAAVRAGSRAVKVGRQTATVWWDDSTPLHEFEYLTENNTPAGYALVSSSSALPAVLEFTDGGRPFTSDLTVQLQARFGQLEGKVIRFYYFGPFDVAASVQDRATGQRTLVVFPEQYAFEIPPGLSINRHSQRCLPASFSCRRRTLNYEVKLDALKPIAYQQGCRAAVSVRDDSGHYCEPNCIAGCVPVSWAMFLSSCKKNTALSLSDRNKIWPGSTCWNIDWPSNTNPSQCATVSDTIWALHDRYTTCDGGSQSPQAAAETSAYCRGTLGINWITYARRNATFDDCDTLVNQNQVFVFDGFSDWSANLAPHLREAIPLAVGKAGHSVVCWGVYISSWTSGEYLLATMGWGKDVYENGAKWFDISTVTDRNAWYIARF